MRIVVTGATGNVGMSLVRLLVADDGVEEIVGIERRLPALALPKTRWVAADLARDEVAGHLLGADAVVHLAWQIQPSRDPQRRWATNVEGTANVLAAMSAAGVRTLVYASSVGAYSPGPKGRPVDESWPTHGVASSTYSREKAYAERLLDGYEAEHPSVRVVRLRPGLIFKREAASAIRRLFLGSLFPRLLLRRGRVPVVPDIRSARFQALHTADAAAGYHRALLADVRGAFNLAAEPVLDLAAVARILGARRLPVPEGLVRPAAALTWRLRLHPVEPGWVDLALNAPILDTARAREELGWEPRWSASDAVRELVEGIAEGAGGPTPVLEPDDERSRMEELVTAQGARGTEDDAAT